MTTGTLGIGCPACGTELTSSAVGAIESTAANGFAGGASGVPCLACGRPLRATLFPAAFRRSESSLALAAGSDEAACFFHAGKRASVPCDRCGRFLCGLCDLEISGAHVCPTCAAHPDAQSAAQLARERTLWDSAALGLAVYPLLLFYFTIITAPITLFIVIRHWRTPTSLMPRSRFRFVLAGLLAVAQLVGWILLIAFLLRSAGKTAGSPSG